MIEDNNPSDPGQNGNLSVAEAQNEVDRLNEVLNRLGDWGVDLKMERAYERAWNVLIKARVREVNRHAD